jgi:hypothetical protein
MRSAGPDYDPAVLNDPDWHARTARVLAGALEIWGVAGAVGPDPEHPDGFVIAPRGGAAIRVRRDAPTGWIVTVRGPGGVAAALDRHAGLPGLLRRLREELAPDAPAGRMVIGAQPLDGGDAGTR